MFSKYHTSLLIDSTVTSHQISHITHPSLAGRSSALCANVFANSYQSLSYLIVHLACDEPLDVVVRSYWHHRVQQPPALHLPHRVVCQCCWSSSARVSNLSSATNLWPGQRAHSSWRIYAPHSNALICTNIVNERIFYWLYSDMFHPCNKSNTKTLISVIGAQPSRAYMSL